MGLAKHNNVILVINIWRFLNSTNYNAHRRVFDLSDARSVLNEPNFRPFLPTVMYVHGFTESTESISVHEVITAYTTNGGYNVLVLDWGPLAGGMYTKAVANMIKVGKNAAEMLIDIFQAGLPISSFHLVGHSLGGQMAGLIGHQVQRQSDYQLILERISALDPAGPLFSKMLKMVRRLNRDDARFVDVIHTDAGFFGDNHRCGTVDFWPNGGSRFQPGCPPPTMNTFTNGTYRMKT